MPFIVGSDLNGTYVKYGQHGKPYYFDPTSSRSVIRAYNKASTQRKAIKVSQARVAAKQHRWLPF